MNLNPFLYPATFFLIIIICHYVVTSSFILSKRNNRVKTGKTTFGRHLSLNQASLESTSTTANNNGDISPIHSRDSNNILHSIGVPASIRDLKIGQTLKAFRRNVLIKDDISNDDSSGIVQPLSNFTIERLSASPDVFILRDFLTNFECDLIVNYVNNNTTMTNAETITIDDTISRKRCKVAWLPSSPSSPSNDGIPSSLTYSISNLVSTTANILLSKDLLSNPSAGVEDLQVLKYDVGGEFVLHHDGEPRILTVIYYINGVGGTWFPLASTTNDNDPCRQMNQTDIEKGFLSIRKVEKEKRNRSYSDQEPKNKAEALQLGQDFKPGEQGLLLSGQSGHLYNPVMSSNPNIARVRKGDAIAFYNYKNDGSGQLDWRALHTGLPTSEEDGVKWIANHWFRLGDLCDEDII